MEIIKTQNAPEAIGPYSQAIKSNGLIFCSGQICLKPEGTLVEGDVKAQAVQVMENLKAVLEAAESNFSKVLKTTIYLVDINDFAVVNEVYGSYFEGDMKPARATVAVNSLPKGVKVEIDCIAEG